ncbi:MAG: hypothetical protein WD470_12960 [Rhodospirillaceae bacterium]
MGKFAAVAALIASASIPAAAQQPSCAKRSDILSHLASRYTEAPVAIGVANNGGIVEVLSSETGSSWTIIITMPNGATCMVAAGENWEKNPSVATAGRHGV